MTIRDVAQQILQNKFNIRDVRAEAYALALLAKNANASLLHLFQLRRELKSLGALSEIIEMIKLSNIIEESNMIQKN
ncbi:604_t:CDS:1, partial [Gigaspora rosea]